MTLGQAQRAFTLCVAQLIEWAYAHGYELTLAEVYRTPEQARIMAMQGSGIVNSNHIRRLAVDLNLFRDGKWLTRTEDHAELGAHWKTLHPLARWGGDFGGKRPDGNHYSFEWEGVQ